MDSQRLQILLEQIQEKAKKYGPSSLEIEEKYFLQLLDQVAQNGAESLSPEEKKFLNNFGNPSEVIPKHRVPEEEENLLVYLPWAIAPILLVLLFALWILPNMRDWGRMRSLPEGYGKMDSEHFYVYYPLSEKKNIEEVVAKGEKFIKEIGLHYSPVLGDLSFPPYKLPLSFFKNHQDFQSYAWNERAGTFANNGGYFDPMSGEIALILSEAPELGQSGIRHEIAHLLLNRGGNQIASGLPPWLSEGLATFLETAELSDPHKITDISLREHAVLGVSKAFFSVGEVVGYSQKDFMRMGNTSVYNSSYLLVYFLVKRDSSAFWKYVKIARQGKETNYEGLLAHLGTPQKKIEEEWNHFLRLMKKSAPSLKEIQKKYFKKL